MKPVLPLSVHGRSACISIQTILFSLFLILFASANQTAHAQVVAGMNCGLAIDVSPGSHTCIGPSVGGGAVNLCTFPIAGDATNAVWYKYTPPADGIISIGSCLGGADTRLSVLSGACGNLYCVGSSDDACAYSTGSGGYASQIEDLTVFAGVTYYIQWDDRWTTSGFDWTLDYTPNVPINDTPCDNIIELNCGDTKTGTTYGATSSGLPLPCTGFGSGKDVFYSFIADGSEEYTITLTGDDIDGVLSAYTGTCVSVSTLLACSDNPGTGLSESITFTAPSGNNVWIRVFDYFSNGGNFELTMACSSVTNDECSGAETIVVDDPPLSTSNQNASSDPDMSIDCSFNGVTDVEHGAWYKFTAPQTGKIVIETFADGMTDSELQVYDGCGGNVIACDEDGGSGLMSKIELPCDSYTPYSTYYILVDGWSGNRGTFDISVTTEDCPAPGNDDCADAIDIPVNGGSIDGTNSGATGSPDISIDCGFEGENEATNDVWFSFEAPSTGQITIETTAGTLTDSQIQVLDACGGNVIACDEDGGVGLMSKITIPCDGYTPGGDYIVQVDGWAGNVGTFGISVSTSPCPAPDNDICADAVALTVHDKGDCAGNEVAGTTSGATSDNLLIDCEPDNPDVFYTFNSGDNSSVIVNLDPVLPGTDMVITLIEGSCSTGTQVVCNGNASPYTLSVTPNTDYTIRVSTNWSFGNFGAFTICVASEFDCPTLAANIGDSCNDGNPLTENDVVTEECTCQGTPENDECSNATELTVHAPGGCVGNGTEGTTFGATASEVDACETGSSDVFYSFNSGSTYNTIRVFLETIDATDLVLSVFEDNCSSEALFCSIGTSQSQDILVEPETTYIIRVHSFYSGSEGAFSICTEGVYDCPDLSANIDDPCDDGDPNTENDVVTSGCTCEGTPVASSSISGTIAGWSSGCSDRDMSLSLVNSSNTYTALPGTVHPDGSFTLNGSPTILPGTYQVLVNVDGALMKLITGVVITSGTNSILVPALIMGDFDNDNQIGYLDISHFSTAYGASTGDPTYDPISDFNCDGYINYLDLSKMSTGYGQSGDEFTPPS